MTAEPDDYWLITIPVTNPNVLQVYSAHLHTMIVASEIATGFPNPSLGLVVNPNTIARSWQIIPNAGAAPWQTSVHDEYFTNPTGPVPAPPIYYRFKRFGTNITYFDSILTLTFRALD